MSDIKEKARKGKCCMTDLENMIIFEILFFNIFDSDFIVDFGWIWVDGEIFSIEQKRIKIFLGEIILLFILSELIFYYYNRFF